MVQQKQKKPKLFWVSAIAPMLAVAIGCLFAFVVDAEKYGVTIVSLVFAFFYICSN